VELPLWDGESVVCQKSNRLDMEQMYFEGH
jgi:hypothetical protein